LVVFSGLFWFVPVSASGYWLMLGLQVLISVLTGLMSPLVWSMYADVSDYAELRYRTASTGLIFSSSSMAQKFGGAIGGAAVLWLLSAFGYQESLAGSAAQPEAAISCLWFMMSWLPAIVALLAVGVASFYPLTTEAVNDIVERLRQLRAGTPGKDVPAEDEMTDFANV
jgi:GPH family glycoside/pentoside/hexuronide:cation symporter